MTINDIRHSKLSALGFDTELDYLQSLGAISNQINDAWLEVAGDGQYNDQVAAYMLANGSTGADMNAIVLNYWLNL